MEEKGSKSVLKKCTTRLRVGRLSVLQVDRSIGRIVTYTWTQVDTSINAVMRVM